MASELSPIDISRVPELAHLVDEVATTGKRRRITRGGRDVAVLQPVAEPNDEQPTSRPLRFPKGSVVAGTAGIVQYDGPPLTLEEERAAFERGVAEEVSERLGG